MQLRDRWKKTKNEAETAFLKIDQRKLWKKGNKLDYPGFHKSLGPKLDKFEKLYEAREKERKQGRILQTGVAKEGFDQDKVRQALIDSNKTLAKLQKGADQVGREAIRLIEKYRKEVDRVKRAGAFEDDAGRKPQDALKILNKELGEIRATVESMIAYDPSVPAL